MPPPRPLPSASPASFAWGALLDASSDLLALLDQGGRFVWVNAGFELQSGHRLPDVLDRSAVDLLGAEDEEGEGWEAVRADLADGRGFDAVELPWVDRSGALRWGRLSMRRLDQLPPESGVHWMMALHDLTEVRALAAQARRVSEMLDTAQEFGRLGTWERKISTGEERWDPHMYRFFGLDPQDGAQNFEEVLGNMNPEENAQNEYMASMQRPGKYSKRYCIEVPGQAPRHVHAQWEVRTSAAGIPSVVNGIMMDDTEAYTLAESFNETSAQLRLAVDLGNVAIWRHDLRSDRMYYNDRAHEVMNFPPSADGLDMSQVRAIIHPDDLPLITAAEERSLQTDRPVDMEARYLHADGWRYVLTRRRVIRDEEGQPCEFVGVALDVSEQVERTRQASELAKRLELAAAAAGMGIWSRDPVTQRIEWNAQMFEVVGRSPAEGIPTHAEWLQIIHPEDRAKVSEVHSVGAESKSSLVEQEYRIVLPDGSVRWLVDRSRHEIRDGHAVHFGITLDATDRVHAEAERQERLMALRESEAKSEFLARMSHELRTPLNAVLGFTQLLQLASDLNKEHREKIARIHTAGEHLLSLINDVLDISSLQQGKLRLDLQPVPLVSVLREALPLVEALADVHGVTLHVDEANGVAYGDRTRIRQVLINLLSNAIKYNRAQGKVCVSSEDEGAEVVMRVYDTGRGMSSQQLSQLFEPFNRLGIEKEAAIQGTGIGLALVKALVERMGGSIKVTSEVGVGSEFEIRLPRSAGASALTEPGRLAPAVTASMSLSISATAPLSKRSGQVLYIEDNPVNQILVEELVRGHVGLSIESKDSGMSGVERARELQPELILVDIQLPDIDGFEVLRRLRQQPETANIPCIALSANAMPEDISRAFAEGFDDYWTKPIDFSTFLTAMQRLFPAR